jgi:hypothetical protein
VLAAADARAVAAALAGDDTESKADVGARLVVHAIVVCAMSCVAAVCASARLRAAASAAVGASDSRPPGRRGDVLSLAPLFGHELPDGRALAADAERAFRVLALEARARELLLASGLPAAPASAPAAATARRPRRTLPPFPKFGRHDLGARSASGRPPPPLPAASPSIDVRRVAAACGAQLASTLRARGTAVRALLSAASAEPSARETASSVPSIRAGSTCEADAALRAERAARADAYAVHAPEDGPMLAELCAWAARLEATEGRSPTVWLRELCAEPSLSAAQLLGHMPCYLARCDKLLLLASPRTPLDFIGAMASYVWTVLGGRTEDVHVELAKAVPPAHTLAAFDAFHVMHADLNLKAALRGGGGAPATAPAACPSGERELGEVAERLRACVRLATVRKFNWAVREVLPAVHDAAAAAGCPRGRHAVAWPAGGRQRAGGGHPRVRGCGGSCGGRRAIVKLLLLCLPGPTPRIRDPPHVPHARHRPHALRSDPQPGAHDSPARPDLRRRAEATCDSTRLRVRAGSTASRETAARAWRGRRRHPPSPRPSGRRAASPRRPAPAARLRRPRPR